MISLIKDFFSLFKIDKSFLRINILTLLLVSIHLFSYSQKPIILGKDIIPNGVITNYTVSPSVSGYNYSWSYVGRNLFQMIPDSTLSYNISIVATDSTQLDSMICTIEDENGKFYDRIVKAVKIDYTSGVYSLRETSCPPNLNDCSGNYIHNFSFASIKNPQSGCSSGAYTDFTSDSRFRSDISLGEVYQADISLVNTADTNGHKTKTYVGLWIDYNNDGDFEDNQEFIASSYSSDSEIKLNNLHIPNDLGYKGQAKLRIRTSTAAPFTKEDGCIKGSEAGETEDYMLNILTKSILEAPQAITPNNDGMNDLFVIRGIDPKSSNTLLITDSMGNKIFERTDYVNDWPTTVDAAALHRGTYYYLFKNGSDVLKGYFILNQ